MRVLQIIDSLRPGGAERMAVNIANALVGKVDGSYLCCTRKEGLLKETLIKDVEYLFLKKNSSLDVTAINKLRKFINKNKIDLIHAHSTSYLIAVLLKNLIPKLKVIWHDHYGNRVNKKVFNFPALYSCSFFFDSIIAVNPELLSWSEKKLRTSNSIFIPNFFDITNILTSANEPGQEKNSFSIVCLANLRSPKNHLNLLKSFRIVLQEFPHCKLYLVGKDYKDDYSKNCKDFIYENSMDKNVIFIDETPEVYQWLKIADIGVISSDSEGLPMALLEYGAAKLPVVCTKVGACSEIIGNNGRLVDVDNSRSLAKNLIFYIKNPGKRKNDSANFNKVILTNYSAENVIVKFVEFYVSVLS